MHIYHLKNLVVLRSNLNKAIRDYEDAKIGGGTFGPDELRSLLLSVEGTLARQRDHGSEHDRQWLSEVLGS